MKEQAYLVIGPTGIRGVRKSKPKLGFDEISVRIELDIPDTIFKRPHIEAYIKVGDEAITPNKISPETFINTKKLIEQETGMKIDLRILPAEKEDNPNEQS